jgi:phosphoserine phosphatase
MPDMSPSRLSPEDLALLLDVTRALAAPFDLRTMLAEVAAAARRVLRAERASVWLVDEAAHELFVEVSSDLGRVRVPVGAGLVGECAATRRPVNVPDCYADARFNAEVDRASGFRTRCSLSLPLVDHRGDLVGVLQVLNREAGAFDASDESLGGALAAQCAVALSRARLAEAAFAAEVMRRELALAAEVQCATLPVAMPALPGYDLHGEFRPAEQTGGDTFDLALLPQGLLVVLADATGHGIAPALSVTQMHAMLRMGFGLGASLEQVFAETNDQLARTLPDGRFVTAFVGLLDPRSHALRFISGGQGPILHFQAARGACTAYRATSFPMGAMPLGGAAALRPAVTLTLAPGDWLVLLSDGLYERADATGALFGRERVERLVCTGAAGTAKQMAVGLLQAADRHAAGAPADDDVTLVLIKRVDGMPGARDTPSAVTELSHDMR